MSDAPVIRAAQYLRMSTEHQRYSLKNQAEAIATYAEAHGYEVVQTYFDPGKSGLTLKERKGLQALLAQALSPTRDFHAILVLDVSRWGRFQDTDQSAHYEFVCREAGIKLVYCEEPFTNDGTPVAAIVKQIKRVMAAEFSRELSEKVRFAHRSHAALGHHQGGPATYGFRRVAVDIHGNPRSQLEPRHWKCVPSDHVVIVPGPKCELNVIRWIFREYVKDGESLESLSRRLNAKGIPTGSNYQWTGNRIRRILSDHRVLGNYVFPKTKTFLRSGRQAAHPDDQLTVRIFDPIVSHRMFDLAQKKRSSRRKTLFREKRIISGLRRLLKSKGYLSEKLINACPYAPTPPTLRAHFGSLPAAYSKVGYKQTYCPKNPISKPEMLSLLRRSFETNGYMSARVINDDKTLPDPSLYK